MLCLALAAAATGCDDSQTASGEDVTGDMLDTSGDTTNTPDTVSCEGPNPEGCTSAGCPAGEVCDTTQGCVPSSCQCDTTTGTWFCTTDCGGGVCVPDSSACSGPNPAGCMSTGCPDGETCEPSGPNDCTPSSCSCDEATGQWLCTDDCGGGVCVPSQTTPCDTDADCTEGEEWCEGGECVTCDNSGQICDLACPDGQAMPTRNGCTPCTCEPINECTSHGECGLDQVCVPGDLCFDWCPAGDPSCCYGNTCQASMGDTCDTDADCAAGQEWCEKGYCVACDNSGALCDLACPDGQRMPTRNGCTQCECVPDNECTADADCGSGEVCNPGDFCYDICPAGDPSCCYGNTCVPENATMCSTDADCVEGQEWCENGICEQCDNSGQVCLIVCPDGETMPTRNGCTPCECVAENECTADGDCPTGETCDAGSECISWCPPDDPSCCWGNACSGSNTGTPCTTDSDCTAGEEWCEGGECVACDNSGLACDLACPDGQEMPERNGCFPCECRDTNECTADGDCKPNETCQAGGDCLSWCPVDDPSCCYGNTCVR